MHEVLRTRLKELRISKGWSQLNIGDMFNITQKAYSNYEKGTRHIPLDLIIKLADKYETSVDYLVGRTDEKKPYPPLVKKNNKKTPFIKTEGF